MIKIVWQELDLKDQIVEKSRDFETKQELMHFVGKLSEQDNLYNIVEIRYE